MNPRARAAADECKGFLDEEEGLRLHQLARAQAPLGPIVEIGSYCGKSAVYLGSGAQAAGGTLLCVDHHRGSEENQPGWEHHDTDTWDADANAMDTLPFLRRTLRRAGLEQTAMLMVAHSTALARIWSTPIGMLFIDGGHSFESARADYEAWTPKIAPGGILAIHDLFPNPADGGQAPIEIYRRACASGDYEELPTTQTLGVLRKR